MVTVNIYIMLAVALLLAHPVYNLWTFLKYSTQMTIVFYKINIVHMIFEEHCHMVRNYLSERYNFVLINYLINYFFIISSLLIIEC